MKQPHIEAHRNDGIAKDESTHGSMFVPVVAGSDKTTVSVATVFCHQMYHTCLAQVFWPLKAGMTTPEVVKCPDGHFCQAIYGLGPYIVDYPEQVWLAAIVQGWCPKCDMKPDNLDAGNSHLRNHKKTEFLINNWDPGTLWTNFGVCADIVPFTSDFPRADIHELLSPDLLHQVIKGMFKDHIIMWVNEYLLEVHRETRGPEIIANIDHRISAIPAFPGLRHFPDGHDLTQWTGDDSKALMKVSFIFVQVYLAAIAGHIPSEVIKCLSTLLDFCQIARRNAITLDALDKLQNALDRFHYYQEFFVGTAGMNRDFISLPCQHSLLHYLHSIRLFGSPNGLCSSIMESKHIKAVKEPWQLDKLAAARRAFEELGMMDGTTASYTAMIQAGGVPQPRAVIEAANDDDDNNDNGPSPGPKTLSTVELARLPGYLNTIEALAAHIEQPRFPELLQRFLYDQLNPDADIPVDDIPLHRCPVFNGQISMYHSAVARYFAPSDLCGAGGMYQEWIRSNPEWHNEHVQLFFSFMSDRKRYPCALVEWFIPGDEPDEDIRMWVVRPEFYGNECRTLTIVHLDCIARAAHLLPVFGSSFVLDELCFSDSLDVYRAYFVNNNIDHHCHEFLS
ncbi:hypothetical protein BJV74DRAFT_879553 [Russula compacta]|nr:hypothetical protein BJV74DRAFT_879553 [Russula compacta]